MYIISGKRSPFCKYIGSSNGGRLKNLSIVELGFLVSKNLIETENINCHDIDGVILGEVFQIGKDGIFEAKNIGLKLGLKAEFRALQVNRNCASGMQAIISAMQEIQSQKADLLLAIGAENMSQIPHIARGLREGSSFKNIILEDYLFESLQHKQANTSMPQTAENIADKYKISRAEIDNYACISHKKAINAKEKGFFKDEIVEIETKKEKIFEDDCLRYDINIENLAKLPAAFKENGLVTAGNACAIADGTAACLVASEKYVKENNLKALCKVVDFEIIGIEPEFMGLGPVPAINKLLKGNNLTIDEIDLFEINEAFAAQYLGVEKELKLPREKCNVNGGAIAIGHPLGASGIRIVISLALELQRRKQKYGIASMCIGGGQGIAMLIENL